MANMRHRSSRNGKSRNGKHNGSRRYNGSNNVINLSAAKSNYEKYIEKAKEAKSSGDRVAAENFFQFADHYKRLVVEAEERKEYQSKKEEDTENSDVKNNEEPKTTEDFSNQDTNAAKGKSNVPQELSIENNLS